jgi:hypothetical protein
VNVFAFSMRNDNKTVSYMKKQILFAASMVLSIFVMAQSQTTFGIRAGLASSSIKGDAPNSLNNLLDFTNGAVTSSGHTGLFAGGYVSIPLSPVMSVEPSISYAQKGYNLRGELNIKGAEFIGANAQAKLTTHYIDMPVVLKANIDGFQVFAGPQVSYLAKADLVTTAGLLGFNLLNKKMDATNQFNRIDAGFTAGVGYQFANGVNLTAAYDHGLTKTDANRNLDAYNRTFKVGLGFSF